MADSRNENDFQFSRDELQNLNRAFKDENFLKLFQDYVQDINSEESRKKYEEEIALLEKDRGYDVKFVHPTPCYVMKFVSNEKKTFINICKNENAGKPTSEKMEKGTEWQIPVILSKPRDEVDKKNSKCKVYDVMFHPQTIELANVNKRFREVVEDTALSMLSESFGISFDAKKAIYPKMKYKGKAPPVILRKKIGSDNAAISCEPLEDYWKKQIEAELPKPKERDPLPIKVPKHTVKYRDIIDMKDFSTMGYTDKSAPKEIIIEILLPNVKQASEIELDVYERKITLKSCKSYNHRYNLELDLSYAVESDNGTAKFDKSKRKLIVTLPLKDRGIPILEESNS